MKRYLSRTKSPILAVKSEVYWGFQIRRMKEIRNVQLHLSKSRPKNYGTITSVLMHMMQYIPHSPMVKTEYLKDALRDLYFDQVMERFGTFFLHDLDLKRGTLIRIDRKDSIQCLLDMSRSKNLQQITQEKAAEEVLAQNKEPTEEYPIGNAPTWQEITTTITLDPTLLIPEWVWIERWNSKLDSPASLLFVQFTINFFLTLSSDALVNGGFSKPGNLKEAMDLWTVRSLKKTVKDVSFKASNHGLEGKVNGKRSRGFGDMLGIFFPPPDCHIRKDSVWHPFFTKGYIMEFHKRLDSLTEAEAHRLTRSLRVLFEEAQCLPNAFSCTPRTAGRLWEQFDGGIRMLTNSRFYKLERVGKAKRSGTNRGKQVKASRVIIEARLDEEHRSIPFDYGRLKARKERRDRAKFIARRSGKKNNRRKPPVRWKISRTTDEEFRSSSTASSCQSEEEIADLLLPSTSVLRSRAAQEVEEATDEDDIDELEEDDEEDDEGDEDEHHMDVDGNDSSMDVDAY
jgi:hypothetical protein